MGAAAHLYDPLSLPVPGIPEPDLRGCEHPVAETD